MKVRDVKRKYAVRFEVPEIELKRFYSEQMNWN
jgi:hypothetical protein